MVRGPTAGRRRKALDAVRQAFAEFLRLPALIIAGFLLLAFATYWIDQGGAGSLVGNVRAALERGMFGDAASTRELLGTIAGALITITSITVSLLLVALQQSASALTHQVYDQFLRNWHNQLYFGVLVGLSLFSVVTYASAGPLNPVAGAIVALAATVFALLLLLVLFYTTVDQMRPVVIIESIRRHAMDAREAQRAMLGCTRAAPATTPDVRIVVPARTHGFVRSVDVARLRRAVAESGGEVEIVLLASIGTYVVFGEPLAEVRARSRDAGDQVAAVIEEAIGRGYKRDLAADPLDGIEELETIAWTSISSAQSDPDAGVLAIYGLRDLLGRWHDGTWTTQRDESSPVVYTDDVVPKLLNAFESLAVVASESMQHQSYAEVLRTFDIVFHRLADRERRRVEDIVLRTLSALGEHVLTAELESAIDGLVATLKRAGSTGTATALDTAMQQLARSIGRLGARSTRSG